VCRSGRGIGPWQKGWKAWPPRVASSVERAEMALRGIFGVQKGLGSTLDLAKRWTLRSCGIVRARRVSNPSTPNNHMAVEPRFDLKILFASEAGTAVTLS
jgi:hypothetical protein